MGSLGQDSHQDPIVPWCGATSYRLFALIELMERLAAIIARPTVNVILCHGIPAPHPRWRSQVVNYDCPVPDAHTQELEPSPRTAGTPRAWSWAALICAACSILISSPIRAVA